MKLTVLLSLLFFWLVLLDQKVDSRNEHLSGFLFWSMLTQRGESRSSNDIGSEQCFGSSYICYTLSIPSAASPSGLRGNYSFYSSSGYCTSIFSCISESVKGFLISDVCFILCSASTQDIYPIEMSPLLLCRLKNLGPWGLLPTRFERDEESWQEDF